MVGAYYPKYIIRYTISMMGHLPIDAGMPHRILVDGILGCVMEVCRIGL